MFRHLKLKKEIKTKKLNSFRIHDEKVLEKYKAIWNRIEDLTNNELNASLCLIVYDDKYTKTKIRTYSDKVYTNLRGLNVQKMIKNVNFSHSFLLIFLLVYENKYYLQVHLDNCAYKDPRKQMIDYLDENLFLKVRNYKCCITIDLIYLKELILLKVIKLRNVRFDNFKC